MTVFIIYFDDNCTCFETIRQHCFYWFFGTLPVTATNTHKVSNLFIIQFNVFLSFSTIFVILLKHL